MQFRFVAKQLLSLKSQLFNLIQNLDDRIFRHNNSGSKATKKANDWKLVYKKEHSSRSEAMEAEMTIKGKKSLKYIENLISSAG